MNIISRTLVLSSMTLLAMPAAVRADTADDCIADYQVAKTQFETYSADGIYECIRLAKALNLIATGSAPEGCEGEDEWHLEAKSVAGNPGSCTTRLMGSDQEGCEVDRITRELAPNEAAQWQNYVMNECRTLGEIRGLGPEPGS